MTHLFKDGFDLVDPTVWTNAVLGNYATDFPRTGTHCYRCNATPTYRDFTTAEEDDGMFIGLGFRVDQGVFNVDAPVIEVYEAQGAVKHLYLETINGSRGWRVKRGDGTTLIDVLPNQWFRGTWHYIELGVKIANSGGTIDLRQDGATIATFTGDTQNGGTDGLIDRVSFPGAGVGELRLDDIYINNEQGAAPDNGFWGDTRIFSSYPNGAGFYTQLTPTGSATNWQNVDEAGAASTADFNSHATDGNKDTYTFQDLPVSVGTIRAVEIRMNAEKSDVGVKGIRSVTRRSSTDSFGQDFTLSEDAAPYMQLLPLDPIAAAAWSIANFNATEFGAEVQDI